MNRLNEALEHYSQSICLAPHPLPPNTYINHSQVTCLSVCLCLSFSLLYICPSQYYIQSIWLVPHPLPPFTYINHSHVTILSVFQTSSINKFEFFTTQLNNSLYLHEEEFVSCFITTMWSFAKTTTMVLVEASVEPLGKDLKNRTPDIFFKSNLKHPSIHCVCINTAIFVPI